MQAFFSLHRISPAWWELDLIERLDQVARKPIDKKDAATAPDLPKLPPGKPPHLRGKRKS